ncbi:MAG: PucR family transcriptional regulator [Solirubrobacterales bacterium]|nr:PucR family transcriptional regulator [Solirubrobacterales bacterium]
MTDVRRDEDPEYEEAWSELIGCLRSAGVLDGKGPLADKMAQRIFVLPSYRKLDRAELRQSWIDSMDASMCGVIDRRHPSDADDDDALRQVGDSRARAGIGVAEMLQTGVTFQTVLYELARELAPESPYRERVLLEFFGLLQSWSAWAMVASAAGHREAELDMQGRTQAQQTDFVRRILSGAIAGSEIGSGIEAYGLDRDQLYHAFRARPGLDADVREVERHLRIAPSAGRRAGMMALLDGDLCGFLTKPPQGPAPLAIGISPPVPLEQLAAVFRLATRALDTALAVGRSEVVGVEQLGLQPAVAADHDIGELMHARYIEPFLGHSASEAAILETVERYIHNDSRLERTAGELHVHPNTVRYRLTRFETITGCSLREHQAVVEVWWALTWHDLRQATARHRERPAA